LPAPHAAPAAAPARSRARCQRPGICRLHASGKGFGSASQAGGGSNKDAQGKAQTRSAQPTESAERVLADAIKRARDTQLTASELMVRVLSEHTRRVH
jgi:hypothetical protein